MIQSFSNKMSFFFYVKKFIIIDICYLLNCKEKSSWFYHSTTKLEVYKMRIFYSNPNRRFAEREIKQCRSEQYKKLKILLQRQMENHPEIFLNHILYQPLETVNEKLLGPGELSLPHSKITLQISSFKRLFRPSCPLLIDRTPMETFLLTPRLPFSS